MERRLKNSIGIWAFGPLVTRFLPAGYHPQHVGESMAERVRRVVDGLGEAIDGFEFHYPAEINEGNVAEILRLLGKDHDVYCLASGLHLDPRHGRGGFTNPDARVRRQAVETTHRGIDLAADLGAYFIIWPGMEGYNYPFQCEYRDAWRWFLEGVQAAVEHANSRGVTVLLEHKNSEPAMNIHMRNIGMTLHVIHKLAALGTDTLRLKVNMDWQHLIMNGENLAEYAALLAAKGLKPWEVLSSMGTMMIAPVVVITLIFQRQIISGLTAGSLK